MEPAAFAHWRRWQVPLCRAAIFRLSTIACWLPLADNRKHHTRASPEKAGALNLGPGGIHLSFAALHESACGTKRTFQSHSAMSAFGGKTDIGQPSLNVCRIFLQGKLPGYP